MLRQLELDSVTRQVPELTSVSPKYATIVSRIAELSERENALGTEKAKLLTEVQNWGATADFEHRSRVNEVIAGKPFEARPSAISEFHDRIGEIEDERRLIREALHLLQVDRADEYRRASKLVCATFAEEHRAMAERYYGKLAAVAETRAEIGRLRVDVERSGAAAGYLPEVGFDLLDGSLDRTGGMAQELRRGVQLGFLQADAIPAELL